MLKKRFNADFPTQIFIAWAMYCEIHGTNKTQKALENMVEDLEEFIHTPVLPEFKPFQKCVKEVLEQWKNP